MVIPANLRSLESSLVESLWEVDHKDSHQEAEARLANKIMSLSKMQNFHLESLLIWAKNSELILSLSPNTHSDILGKQTTYNSC